MNNFCVSVIVPIYNVQGYVRKCIESIINQTYKNLQIILIDDGSTDLSGTICDEYGKYDNRIEVIHQKNSGLVSARKTGLSKATGDYIGFVDGDDYIDENMYESLLKCIINKAVDMVHTGYWYEHKNNKNKRTNFDSGFIQCYNEKIKFINDMLVGNTNIENSIWSKLFKRDLIIKSYNDVKNECSYGEDMICFFSAIFNCEKMYICPEAYYHYNVRNDSVSHGMGIGAINKEIILYNNAKYVLEKYGVYNCFKDKLDYYFGSKIVKHMKDISSNPFAFQKYYFSNIDILQGKNIIIYGAGSVGKDYYSQFRRYSNCNVVAWVDEKYNSIKYDYINIEDPRAINNMNYDYIIIAVLNQKVAVNIVKDLKLLGVNQDKILWETPQNYI